MSSLLLIDRSRTGHRHVPFLNIHNYILVVIVLTTLAIIFIPTSHIPTSHIQRSRLIFGGPILGLRHALPDGLRSTEGVSLRISTCWTTAPFGFGQFHSLRRILRCMVLSMVWTPFRLCQVFRIGPCFILYTHVGFAPNSPFCWTGWHVPAYVGQSWPTWL